MVKININSFGVVVRPRIVSYARVYPRLNVPTGESKWSLDTLVNASPYDEKDISYYGKSYDSLFEELAIGDTTEDLKDCYAGVITSFVTSISFRNYILVTQDNVTDVLEKLRRKNNSRESIPVHYVGIKFYKGLQRDKETGKLVPLNPWHVTEKETTWFYRPWDLISMDTIVRYEMLASGDLVLFRKSRGLVLKKKTINKKRFYKTNSWSCKSVTVLLGNGRSHLKFLPNKSFKKA